VEKSSPIICATFDIKKADLRPNRRRFAQSCHPASNGNRLNFFLKKCSDTFVGAIFVITSAIWRMVGSVDVLRTGLPNGLHTKKKQFQCIFEGLAMENFGMFHGQLVYFRRFGILFWYFVAILVHYFPFWFVVQRKIWQP
jgi:hypothetical protein